MWLSKELWIVADCKKKNWFPTCKPLNFKNKNNRLWKSFNQLYRTNLWFGQDQREWKKHLWMKSNEIKKAILVIDFDWTFWNDPGSLTVWRFGIPNSINPQSWDILSNVTLRGYEKLPSYKIMVIDFRLGRSIFNHFRSIFILRIVNEHDSLRLFPWSVYLSSWMDRNDGRSRLIRLFKFIQHFQSLCVRNHKMHLLLI